MAIVGDKKREDIRGNFTCIGDGPNDITMLTAAFSHGQSAVIADKDSTESKELAASLKEAIKPYENYATGNIVALDGNANDYILQLAKEKLAKKVMKQAVGIAIEDGEIPNAEIGKPVENEIEK